MDLAAGTVTVTDTVAAGTELAGTVPAGVDLVTGGVLSRDGCGGQHGDRGV